MIRIAIDVMGGDEAPQAPVVGAMMAAREWSDLQLTLVGNERAIIDFFREAIPDNVSVLHTEEVIEADDEPVRAVRRKKEASLVKACKLVKDGEADAAISSGNTGALMAAGLFTVGRISGIARPGLAPIFPTIREHGVLVLDVGANMDAKPDHLVQYGLMGSIYVEKVLGIARPRVGLLNVGTESVKGNELTRAAFPLLQQLPIHFIGNVEARDVIRGVCDVLVCDGFSGNILLKSVEGVADVIFATLKNEMTRNLPNKLAAYVLKPGLSRFKAQMDYTEYGGAPLLGLNGAIIKSHGSSNDKAIKNAIRQARKFVQGRVIEQIGVNLKGSGLT